MRVSLNYNLMDLKFLNSEMEAAQLDVDYQKECDESRKYIYKCDRGCENQSFVK